MSEQTDHIIDGLTEAGYTPIAEFGDIFTTSKTVDYYARKGWDAVRVLTDSIQFAKFGDAGCRLMSTTYSGVINTEARFSTDRHGVRMFLMSAGLRP